MSLKYDEVLEDVKSDFQHVQILKTYAITGITFSIESAVVEPALLTLLTLDAMAAVPNTATCWCWMASFRSRSGMSTLTRR